MRYNDWENESHHNICFVLKYFVSQELSLLSVTHRITYLLKLIQNKPIITIKTPHNNNYLLISVLWFNSNFFPDRDSYVKPEFPVIGFNIWQMFVLSIALVKVLFVGQEPAHHTGVDSGITRLDVVNFQGTGVECAVELNPVPVAVHVTVFTRVTIVP